MSWEIVAYQARGRDYSGQLFEADGVTPVVLNAGDKVRFKAGRGPGAVPAIDLVSGTASPNGSLVTVNSVGSVGPPAVPASYTVSLAPGDLAGIDPGPYDGEVIVVVASTGYAKEVEVGILHVIADMGGAVS